MSTIGPAGFAAQIASSVANTKRTDAHAARDAATSEGHRLKTENEPSTRAEALEDVGEPDLDADRDPDGRRAWELGPPVERPDDEVEAEREKRRNDSLDFAGGELDVEA